MFLVNQSLTGNGVELTMLTFTISRRRTDEVTLYLKVVVDPVSLTTPVAITVLTQETYLLGEKYPDETSRTKATRKVAKYLLQP